ncbi:hypothetical protein XENORESO_018566 [Xenotaenia resolanae]|uniref:Uncharacterized protein n=1 Tax=Xenotaenia resolanae TaxID=208358 RepID=A0ABV0VV07_9TELE
MSLLNLSNINTLPGSSRVFCIFVFVQFLPVATEMEAQSLTFTTCHNNKPGTVISSDMGGANKGCIPCEILLLQTFRQELLMYRYCNPPTIPQCLTAICKCEAISHTPHKLLKYQLVQM